MIRYSNKLVVVGLMAMLLSAVAEAQVPATVDGIIVLANTGDLYYLGQPGNPAFTFVPQFPFDVARSIAAVGDSTGREHITGMVLLDGFGGTFNLGEGPDLNNSGQREALNAMRYSGIQRGSQLEPPYNGHPYWGFQFQPYYPEDPGNPGHPWLDINGDGVLSHRELKEIVLAQIQGNRIVVTGTAGADLETNWRVNVTQDAELSPDWYVVDSGVPEGFRVVTNAFAGYYILDNFGAVFPVGPDIDYNNGVFPADYQNPNTHEGSESHPTFKRYGLVNSDCSVSSPPYFWGLPIMRDMEVSMAFRTELDPNTNEPYTYPTGEVMYFGQTNGYYLLDGFGGIHISLEDVDVDFKREGLNAPVRAPWAGSPSPYFGADFARRIRLTPDGNGFYLLDAFGVVHAVNAPSNFPSGDPLNNWGFLGMDIARDIAPVADLQAPDPSNALQGLYMITGFGELYRAGGVPDFQADLNQAGAPFTNDNIRGMEVSPVYRQITNAAYIPCLLPN